MRWIGCRAFSVAVLLACLPACGDETSAPPPMPATCSDSQAGLSGITLDFSGLSRDANAIMVGQAAGFAIKGTIGIVTIGLDGTRRSFLDQEPITPVDLLEADDGVLLLGERPSGGAFSVFWSSPTGELDAKRHLVEGAQDWIGVTATAAFGLGSVKRDDGTREHGIVRLDRASGALTLLASPPTGELDFGLLYVPRAVGRTEREIVGVHRSPADETGVSPSATLFVVPLDGAPPYDVALPFETPDLVVLGSTGKRVLVEVQPPSSRGAASVSRRVVLLDVRAPAELIELGGLPASPGKLAHWDGGIASVRAFVVASETQATFVYDRLGKEDIAGTVIMTSDLTPNSLRETGCYAPLVELRGPFVGHPSTGVFSVPRDIGEPGLLRRLAPPL